MARYGTIHDGINDYQQSTASELDISTAEFAFGFFVNLESKSSPNNSFHYILSTGSFASNEAQFFYRQNGAPNNTFGFTLAGNAASSTSAYPAVIGTEHLAVIGRDALNQLKFIICPTGGSATSENLDTETNSVTGKTWQWMRRGDASAARYAKGVFSNPFRANRMPTIAEVESIASGTSPASAMGADAILDWQFETGTGTSDTDDILGRTISQVNMPTDDSQWVLLDGGGSVTADVSATALLPIVSASASAKLPSPAANVSVSAPLPSVSASLSATLPQPSADVSFSALLPIVSAEASATLPNPSASVSLSAILPQAAVSASATLPAPSASVSVTSILPTVSASLSATLPQPSADVSVTAILPQVSVSAEATQSGFVADVAVTALLPQVSAEASATLPQPEASIAATALLPSVSASASATLPDWSVSVNVTALMPQVVASGSATLPNPAASISVTSPMPIVSISATVSGIEIVAAPDARITLEPGSNRLKLQPGSNRIKL